MGRQEPRMKRNITQHLINLRTLNNSKVLSDLFQQPPTFGAARAK